MKNVLPKIVLLFNICMLFSCENNKSPFYDTILKLEEGQFRGAQIGASITQIKSLENEQFLRDKMPDYLHYDYEINMGNTYTVTYDFSEENELYEIEVAIFLDQIEDATPLFKNFSDYFNRKYSVGRKEADGYMTWHTKSTTNDRVAVSIINDSQSYGFITIFIRNIDY